MSFLWRKYATKILVDPGQHLLYFSDAHQFMFRTIGARTTLRFACLPRCKATDWHYCRPVNRSGRSMLGNSVSNDNQAIALLTQEIVSLLWSCLGRLPRHVSFQQYLKAQQNYLGQMAITKKDTCHYRSQLLTLLETNTPRIGPPIETSLSEALLSCLCHHVEHLLSIFFTKTLREWLSFTFRSALSTLPSTMLRGRKHLCA